MRVLLPVLILGFIFASLSAGEDSTWIVGWKAASTKATESKRPVLANFTGSDWCGWCKKLKKEVFDTKEFLDWAKTSVVLLEVDFPHGKALPAALKKENDALSKKHKVEGFPTILIMSSEGKVLGELGYMEGGPKPWLKSAEEIIAKGQKAK